MKKKTKKARPKHYRAHQPDPPVELDDRDKRSPNSLRRVFNAIRQTYPGGPLKHPAFLKELERAWAAEGYRYQINEVTGQIFRASEEGKAPLQYWQLECYANLLEVPSAALLLISRLTMKKAHVSDDPARTKKETPEQRAKALATAKGIRALLVGFEQRVSQKDTIDDQDIHDLIADYVKSSKVQMSSQ